MSNNTVNANVAADIEELFERFSTGEFKATSEFGARDESIQSNMRQRGFKKHQYTEGANILAFLPKELALPFNPSTGKPDDTYNEGNKFRPAKSWDTGVRLIKLMVSKNKAVIPTYLKRANLPLDTAWDVDDIATITDIDRQIFRGYTVLRTLTETVVTINSKKITGSKDGSMNYRVSIYRDQMGNVLGTEINEDGVIVGGTPDWLQMAQLFTSQNIGEIKKVTDLREAEDANWRDKWQSDNPALEGIDIVACSDEIFKDVKRAIRKQGLITEEFPTNYVVAYMFEIDNSTNLIKGAENLKGMTITDIEENMFLLKRGKNLNEAIEKFKAGQSNASEDVFDNFYELQIQGPTNIPESPIKKMQVALKTSFSVPAMSIARERDPENTKSRGYNPGTETLLTNLIVAKQDDVENIELRFKSSTRTRQLDSTVDSLLLKEFASLDLLDNRSEYLTDGTIFRLKEILIKAYGESAINYLEELESGIAPSIPGETSNEDLVAHREEMNTIADDIAAETDYDSEEEKTSEDAIEAAKNQAGAQDIPIE